MAIKRRFEQTSLDTTFPVPIPPLGKADLALVQRDWPRSRRIGRLPWMASAPRKPLWLCCRTTGTIGGTELRDQPGDVWASCRSSALGCGDRSRRVCLAE